MPPICTLRVDKSIKKRTMKRVNPEQVHTSTVKKSMPAKTAMWDSMNSFQVVFWLRLGAAVIIGMIRDGVILHGFDVIDQYEERLASARDSAGELAFDEALHLRDLDPRGDDRAVPAPVAVVAGTR